jgi:Ca-activated chloride channel family protein
MARTLPTLTDQELHTDAARTDEAGFGALATPRGPLPLKAMDISARIDGLVSETSVCQTFVNTLDEPLEATYIFPLPDRAAVTRFRLQVGKRLIEGVLKERAEARREYDQALEAGHRAAITEEERAGVFTMRVGNIMPGEEATVHLNLVGPLPYSEGEVTFRFPLVVAPRYIPGTPLPGASVGSGVAADTDAVPDASRITPPVLLPGYPHPVSLSLAVEVQPGTLPLGACRSSLHAVLEEKRDGVRRIVLHPGARLDRDFILRFRLGEEAVRSSLTLKPDEDDAGQGTFLLTLVPPIGLARGQRPRDIVFVIDRSGSMGGWKMVAARRALARMVDTLGDRDRFAVYAFDDSIEMPPGFAGKGLAPAMNRNRFRAVEFLAQLHARGGTEMAQPLARAVTELSRPGIPEPAGTSAGNSKGRDRILVLVTDGQVGNEDQILHNLGKRLKNIRIFTLGIDRAVNDAFLKRLAAAGGGACELVESEDRLDEVMDRVHRRIGTALLTDLHLEPAGLRFEPDALVPARLPDLFAGAPLCLIGRYHGQGQGALALQARDAEGRAWSETVPAARSANTAVTCMWARGHIRELEDRYVLGERNLEKQLVATSLRFGVLCRFTAFVAVDRSEVVNAGGPVHQITQPVEAPEGWEMLDAAAAPSLCCKLVAPGFALESVDSMLQESTGMPMELAQQDPSPGARRALRGMMRRVFKRSMKVVQSAQPAPSGDLASYRLQAAALLQALQSLTAIAADVKRRLKMLASLAGRLATLIRDLRLIKLAAAELQPLEKLHEELEQLAAKKRPSEEEVMQAWKTCEQVLQTFAGNSAASPAAETDRRQGFWK